MSRSRLDLEVFVRVTRHGAASFEGRGLTTDYCLSRVFYTAYSDTGVTVSHLELDSVRVH